jgi:hypothetical protein
MFDRGAILRRAEGWPIVGGLHEVGEPRAGYLPRGQRLRSRVCDVSSTAVLFGKVVGMRVQYAAINDLESVADEIMKLGGGRIAIVFDPKLGWCVTDEVDLLPAEGGGQVVVVKARTYADWYQPHIANAMNLLGGVRFLGQSAMDKLFRKPLPPKAPIPGDTPNIAPMDTKGLASVGRTTTPASTQVRSPRAVGPAGKGK